MSVFFRRRGEPPAMTIAVTITGSGPRVPGTVTIDGTEVLRVTYKSTKTYNWTVPDGIQTIAIDMFKSSAPTGDTVYAEITVTTA